MVAGVAVATTAATPTPTAGVGAIATSNINYIDKSKVSEYVTSC